MQGRAAGGRATTLRYEPPQLAPGILGRARLVGALRGRFERRLTEIVAGPGFGKSTLLAQAVYENRIEQFGVDIWLRVDDRDREPSHLLGGLASAVEATGRAADDDELEVIVDSLWNRTPTSIALVLDDVHVLDGAAASIGVITSLLDRLPSNVHLVLSGRIGLDLGGRTTHDDVMRIDEGDLAFTVDELAELATLRAMPDEVAAQLPTWPALATLTGQVGIGASIEYLWDEVLAGLDAGHRRILATVAEFGELDDELVESVCEVLGERGGSAVVQQCPTTAELLDGLPLVETTESGTFRLHDLWTASLAHAVDPIDRAAALRAGGALFLRRAAHVRAAEAYALAGDLAGVREVVMAYGRMPNLEADQREVERLDGLLPAGLRATPIARYLDAARYEISDERRAAILYQRAADDARAAGEADLEVLATWRVIQFNDLDSSTGPEVDERVAELAAQGVPLARSVLAFVESRRAQVRGEPQRSLEFLDELDEFDPAQRATTAAIRLIDLGRPELIPATLESVLASGVDSIFDAQAVWLQGTIDPTAAWPIARQLIERGVFMPVTTRASLDGVLVTMAIAAGAREEAISLLDEARRLAVGTPEMVHQLVEAAGVLVDLVTWGEDAALARLARMLELVPLGNWPERPYLYLLSVIRGLVPGGDMLDGCAFGPSFTVGVRAGAALAALRTDDPRPARELPWTELHLLRVHVPPPLLVELALASVDIEGAEEALASVPDLRTWVRRTAERHPEGTTVGTQARRLLAALPQRPSYDLHVRALGTLQISRSDGVPIDGWDRRARVRQLLAYLLVVREVDRATAAAVLWPDLDIEKASANLRVNLHHLQQALQPDRAADEPPWFVRSDGSRLRLATEGLVLDVERFDDAVAAAARAESDKHTARALELFRQANELYVGDLLPDVDEEWVEVERMRLRSAVTTVAVRCGELVLARGEPESAMAFAVRAQRLDPIGERAVRLFIRCQLALGSVGTARQAGTRLRTDLAQSGLTPEPETLALLDRLQV